MEPFTELTALGYIGVRSSRLDEWGDYATRLLGMQAVDQASTIRAFRMDDRKQRLIVQHGPEEGLGFIGWETTSAAALDRLATRLEAHGIAVRRAPRALADERHVKELIQFLDPAGNPLEVFHGAAIADTPFRPSRPISGFRTGPFGMGHAVLNVEDATALLPFYRDVLGFHVSDYGLTPYALYFFHLNGRHHSFAMVGSGKRGVHHFMVEFCQLDDVGQGYDLALLETNRLAYTLGRHTNDHMTSYYTHTPSGFFVETGWGGRTIDPPTWQPHETFDGPSLWGHDRLYMEPEPRAKLQTMRLDAAARGIRAPVVLPDCPWAQTIFASAEKG
ncbi:VOC family protein [Acidocella sp.]|uniref:VOC family protein n=1 Tax=Acidocella sp. TaxID=50710 RepID=UPI003D053206